MHIRPWVSACYFCGRKCRKTDKRTETNVGSIIFASLARTLESTSNLSWSREPGTAKLLAGRKMHKHAAEAEANAATAAVSGKWKPERKTERAKVRERGTARGSRPGSAACSWSLINAACLAGKSLCLVRSTCNCHADSWLAIPLYLALPLPLYPHPVQGSPVENFLCTAASWTLIFTSQFPYAARFALLLQSSKVC